MKYAQAYDGKWCYAPRSGFKLMCCDCGLVHDVTIKSKNKRLYLILFRNNQATAVARRRKQVYA